MLFLDVLGFCCCTGFSSHCRGFSFRSTGSTARGLQLWQMGSVAAPGLQSTGSVAPGHVGSSQTEDPTLIFYKVLAMCPVLCWSLPIVHYLTCIMSKENMDIYSCHIKQETEAWRSKQMLRCLSKNCFSFQDEGNSFSLLPRVLTAHLG